MYPHTLNIVEQETGTIGVSTPCSFDDDDDGDYDDDNDNDEDDDDDVGESLKKLHWQSRNPLAHFHLPQLTLSN